MMPEASQAAELLERGGAWFCWCERVKASVSGLLFMRVSTFQACDGSAHPQTTL